jgi:hypothetical protein
VSESWCDNCRSNHAFWCDNCEAYLTYDRHTSYTLYDSDGWYCDDCASNNWNYCSDCENYYDSECGCGDRSPIYVHSYNYKPDPIFRTSDESYVTQATGLCLGV